MSTKNDAHKQLDGRTEIYATVGTHMTDRQTDRRRECSYKVNRQMKLLQQHTHLQRMADEKMNGFKERWHVCLNVYMYVYVPMYKKLSFFN